MKNYKLEAKVYKDCFEILMQYFDSISDEEQPKAWRKIEKQLKKLKTL